MATLKILYLCACLVAEAEVVIPAREEKEDLMWWMDNVVSTSIYLDHRKRSPSCKEVNMTHVKIPIPDNADWLGQEPPKPN